MLTGHAWRDGTGTVLESVLHTSMPNRMLEIYRLFERMLVDCSCVKVWKEFRVF